MCRQKRWACCCKKTTAESNDGGIPVDRGWAWVIVFASAGLYSLITGTFKCFGLLKIEIQTNYPECGQDTTLWIMSLCSIVSLLAGCGFSTLVEKTSHRIVGIIGSSLCSTGLLLTAFSPNCQFMFLSLVVVYSTGVGGVMVVVFTAFADYFCKHRGLAVGMMASGSGFGSLVVPKLLSYLFETYTFRDALLCYAAVYMQSIILASLLRPSSYYKKSSQKVDSPTPTESETDATVFEEENEEFLTNIVKSDGSLQEYPGALDDQVTLEDETCLRSNTLPAYAGNNKQLTVKDEQKAEFTRVVGSSYSFVAAPFVSTHTLNDLDNIGKHSTTDDDEEATEASSCVKANSAKYKKLCLGGQLHLLGALVFFAVNSINLIFTTAPSFAAEKSVEVDVVANIMTLSGTAEIVFRMIHGWLADRRIISALTQICIIMLSCTVASFCCAFLHGVVGIGIMYAVMSLCGTTLYSLLPIVIIEQIGKEHLVNVLGIFYIYQALAFSLSTVVANGLYDAFHTWEYVFYYIGACYMMATTIGVFTFLYYSFFKRMKCRITSLT